MKSPFKFLDAFTLADKDAFFGRSKEIQQLYDMSFRSPLIMVYGLSGAGKTSLLQCGLASRFDGPDWFPLYIRRGNDINLSLHEALDAHLKTSQTQESLEQKMRLLYRKYLSPIYLIFDQFEELFAIGTYEEQKTFLDNLKELLNTELSRRIILVMREEFLGHLNYFEQHIPHLFEFRLRVEQMDANRIKHVIHNSFQRFNINTEPPQEERLTQIVDNISSENTRIQLPYLQVYLDALYTQTYKKKYRVDAEQVLPPLTISAADIDELGELEVVLESFIAEQQQALQVALKSKYPDFPENGIDRILKGFVTDDGTKRPVFYTRVDQLIQPEGKFKELLSDIDEYVLTDAIKGLKQKRILRDTQSTYELAHDSLAPLIDATRSEQERQISWVRSRLRYAYQEYQDNGNHANEKLLGDVEEINTLLRLDEELKQFVEVSKVAHRRKRRKKIARISIIIIAVMAIIIALYSNATAKLTPINDAIAEGKRFKNQGNYTEAIRFLKEADSTKAKLLPFMQSHIKEDISKLLKDYKEINTLMKKADSLRIIEKSNASNPIRIEVRALYEQAYLLSSAMSKEADSVIYDQIIGLDDILRQDLVRVEIAEKNLSSFGGNLDQDVIDDKDTLRNQIEAIRTILNDPIMELINKLDTIVITSAITRNSILQADSLIKQDSIELQIEALNKYKIALQSAKINQKADTLALQQKVELAHYVIKHRTKQCFTKAGIYKKYFPEYTVAAIEKGNKLNNVLPDSMKVEYNISLE